MTELCDHEEKCVLLKEMKKGYYMKNSELRKENEELREELKGCGKALQGIAQRLLKLSC